MHWECQPKIRKMMVLLHGCPCWYQMSFKCLYYLRHQGTVRAVEEGVAHHAKQQGLRNVPRGRDLQIGLMRLTLLTVLPRSENPGKRIWRLGPMNSWILGFLIDLTGELRVATFWWNPKAFSTFSILAHWTWDQHPDKSKLQHDRWNWYGESYPSTSQITWNHTYHHAAHAFHKRFAVLLLLPIARTEVLLSSPWWRQPNWYQKL